MPTVSSRCSYGSNQWQAFCHIICVSSPVSSFIHLNLFSFESDIWPSMVTHTRNLCSAFIPSKVHTHSSEHTSKWMLHTGGGWGETPLYDCKALWVYSNTQLKRYINDSFIHSFTHTPWTHTRSSGQPFMLRRPGSSWGFGALLKGTSVVVLKVERALDIHSPHLQFLPDLRLEPVTFGLRVRLSNH